MHEFDHKCIENDYVFIHIPKSGGSFLNIIFSETPYNILGMVQDDKNVHLGLNPKVKAKYFTIIRKPIERYWSHYH